MGLTPRNLMYYYKRQAIVMGWPLYGFFGRANKEGAGN